LEEYLTFVAMLLHKQYEPGLSKDTEDTVIVKKQITMREMCGII